MNRHCLNRRLRRLESGWGITPPCPRCRGIGCRRAAVVHAALHVVEHRGCPVCGKIRNTRPEAATAPGGGSCR
ncbi:MAG: hypothetical protein KF787_00400 [Phycisphaeraceae bacterium]|nr:hypothetical protein [Phycisphaerae bacterium]MBX3391082.1 hypothetical protein [Phycisphaeraceae bacterium]